MALIALVEKRPQSLRNKIWKMSLQKVGKLVRSHVKLASNLNTAISNMADVVQWHLRRVAVCVLVLLYVNRRRIKRKTLEK